MNIRKVLKVYAWLFAIVGVSSVIGYGLSVNDDNNARIRKEYEEKTVLARNECDGQGGIQIRGYKGQEGQLICAKLEIISVNKE